MVVTEMGLRGRSHRYCRAIGGKLVRASEVRKVVIANSQPLSAIIGGFAGARKSGPDQPDRAALPMSRAALAERNSRRPPTARAGEPGFNLAWHGRVFVALP